MELLQKIGERSARVGIVGLGYAGLPLAVGFAEAGFEVTGIDINRDRVDRLNRGDSYIQDIASSRLALLVEAGRLRATTDYADLGSMDTINICVPTPLRKAKNPDISFIVAAAEAIARHLRVGQLIVLESTTYPGTTEEVILPLLEAGGLRVGRDFFLAFAPERVDPGNRQFGTRNTPKLVGGVTAACTARARALYQTIVDEVLALSSPQVAETAKLLENTFRAVNIALVNEMAIMCGKLGVDVWEVIDAAATKPFGFMPFYPGPGLGGHCIPVVPYYLSWKLKTLNYTARFIELAGEVNGYMPTYVVEKVGDLLNDVAKAIRGARVLVLGVTYKRDVNDIRESPSLDILTLLLQKGARVAYHDPLVPELVVEGVELESVALTEGELRGADCVVVGADHGSYDWSWIADHAPAIVDTRNALRGVPTPRARVVRI